jgi:hypothetical protein
LGDELDTFDEVRCDSIPKRGRKPSPADLARAGEWDQASVPAGEQRLDTLEVSIASDH